MVDQKKWVIQGDWQNNKEIEYLNQFMFLTAKPIIYLVNLSEKDFVTKKNKFLPKIKAWIDQNMQGEMIPYSADFERKLVEEQLQKEEKKVNEADLKDSGSMLPRIVKSGYKVLDLIYFFTAGPDEVRAWTVKHGKKAPQAAGVIHTDFEKGFICAEIMKYEDFVTLGGEA